MSDVARHYAPEAVARALAEADDPALDQLHLGGLEATRALIRFAAFPAGASILDIGGGLGGPARVLAVEAGVRVTVLDLTDAFCRAGESLARRHGVSDRVAFRQGDAAAPPFPDAAFDGAWTIHSTMNVRDKARLFAEARRVLRPGGRLAMYEICAGPAGPIRFPVPWARDPSLSFLVPPVELRACAREAGFRELAWEDTTSEVRAKAGGGPKPSLVLLFGEALAGLMAENMRANFSEDRLRVVRGLWVQARP